jgi:large subunit ribosomal protein L10
MNKKTANQSLANPGQKRKEKEEIVTNLSEKVKRAKSIIFTNYQGLTHQQLERIKKTTKKLEAEYVTTKNTLLKLALENGQKTLNSQLPTPRSLGEVRSTLNFQQPTATLFIYNNITQPLKELIKVIKELNLPKIKFGIFEGKIITEQEINKIAALPPLPVLRAQLLGQMKAPISGLHRALNWNIQKFVMTLNTIKVKKT